MAHYQIYNNTISIIDPRLFGTFMGWGGGGGEIGYEGALVPGSNKLQPAVVDKLREMQLPIVRFNGGTMVDYFDWRDMISNAPGRSAARPGSVWPRGNETNSNNFGLDEFLRLREKLGFDVIMDVNFGNGLLKVESLEDAAQQAAGMVAYCNTPVGTKLPPGMPDWPAVRSQNGHPEPYKVKCWQLGNETWVWDFRNRIREMNLADPDRYYADCVLAYARAMLAVDPSIEFLVDGVKGGQLAHAEMPDKIRHLVFHIYKPWIIHDVRRNGKPVPIESLSASDIWYVEVATPGFTEGGVAIFKDSIQPENLIPLARQQGFNLAVTEWNWNGWLNDSMRKYQNQWPLNSSFAAAVGAAGFLHAMMRSSDVIDIGCQSQLVGTAWGIDAIRVDASGQSLPYYLPAGQLMALYAGHHGPRLLAMDASNIPTYAQPLKMGSWAIGPDAHVAYLDTLATANDQTIFLYVINRAFDHDMTMRFDFIDFGPIGDKAQRYTLVGRLNDHTSNADESVRWRTQITHSECTCDATGLTLQVPARSVSCIEIPLKR